MVPAAVRARIWFDLPRPIRYGAVSAACLVLHNAIVIGAAAAGATILQAAATSFCIMVVVGYLLLCGAVFAVAPHVGGFLRYLAAMAANFPVSTGLLWGLAGPIGLPVAYAAPIATVAMVVLNFLWARWAIVRAPARP